MTMSRLACGRATRAGALALAGLLAATLALAATLTLAGWPAGTAPARGNVCDAPVISAGCDAADAGAGAIGDAVDATTGAAVDLSRWAVRHVATAVSWSAEHAAAVAKTLAAAGIAVGVWVGCSKVLKALAAAGGGALATGETAGAGTAAGALAGAAAAQLACRLVRAGGRLILKTGKAVLRSGGALSKIGKLAAAATGLAAILYGTQHAAGWVLLNLLDLDAPSGRQLGDRWVAQLRSKLNGNAAVLLVLVAIVSLGLAALRGSVIEARQVLEGLIGAALLISVVGSLVYALVVWSDAITNGLLHSHWGQRALGDWRDLGDAFGETTPVASGGHAASALVASASPAAPANGTPPDDGTGVPWMLRLLIAMLTAFFGAFVWVEQQIRDGALVLVLVFSGFALAFMASPRLRELAHRFALGIAGVVVAGPVMITTLLVGGSLTQTAAAADDDAAQIKAMLVGVGLMAVAAFAGWGIVGWLGVHGAGAIGQIGARLRGAGAGTFTGGAHGGRHHAGDHDDERGGAPRSAGADAAPARELARDLAARVPDAVAAPAEQTAALPGAERVRQAREREQRHASDSAPPSSSASPVSPDAPQAMPAEGPGSTTHGPATGAGEDRAAPDATSDPERSAASFDDDRHADARTRNSIAGEPGDGATAGRGAGAGAGAPVTELAHVGAAGGAPPASAPATRGAVAAGAPGSLDELSRTVGLPAEHPGLPVDAAHPVDDAQGVQRAFGEHAATVREYLARGRGGAR